MNDFLNKTGVPNIENTIFRRLQNKFNHLPSQPNGTTPPASALTDSLYSIKNSNNISDLYFNGNQITTNGGIGSNIWEVDSNDNTQVITLNSKNVSLQNLDIKNIGYAEFENKNASTSDAKLYVYNNNLYFGSIQLDSPHTTAYWNLNGSTLSPNGAYNISMEVSGTRHNIENIANLTAETIAMIGSTRTITNMAGMSFTALNPYINGLQNLDFSTTLNTSINNLDTLNVATANTTTTNATNTYTTNLSVDYISGRAGSVINISPNNALLSGEIQVDNGNGNAPLYANQIWIGTKGNNPTPLANWVIERIGTQSNESYANFWVYPQPIDYLQLELKDGNTDNKSGLKTDILIVDNVAEINSLFAHQFTSSGAGGNVFDFFDTAGTALLNAGESFIKFKLAQKALRFGLYAAGAIASVSIAGNIIYHAVNTNTTPDYFAEAKEYGCEDQFGGVRYTIAEPLIGGPDNSNGLFSFAMNALYGGGRLCSQGYIQTENARNLIEGPPSETIAYSMIWGHDGQRSMEFLQYTSQENWEGQAKQGLTGGTFRTGANMYSRRLMSVDDAGSVPRLRFNGIYNILAYKSEIDAIDYWEVNNGNLQPNSNSGVSGLLQINSGAINAYRDLYLVNSNINFTSSTKGRISYDDTAKTLTFRNGDNNGEFIFNDYLDNPRFKIDTTNNRIEIPQGHLYFQENGDQDVYKAGTGNLNFKYGGTITAYMESGKGLSVPNAMYFDYTGGGTGAPPGGTLSGLYRVGNAPDDFLNFSGHKIADYRYGTTGTDLETPNLWIRNSTIYFDDPPSYTTNTTKIYNSVGNLYNHVEANKTIQFEIGTSPTVNTYMKIETAKTTINNNIFFDGDSMEFNTSNPPATTTNKLYRNGTDLYYNGVNLSSGGGSTYFTDNGTTATSSNLDFNFTQAVEIDGQLTCNATTIALGGASGGGNNLIMTLPTGSNNSQITINSGQRFINYNANTSKGLYISHQGGTDAENNIQFQLHASPTTYFKIDDTNSTFYTNVVLDTAKNITMSSGDLNLSNGDINITTGNLVITGGGIDVANDFKLRSSNVATNVMDVNMSDTSVAFSFSGGSNPDAYYFKDYNSANIVKIQRDDFQFLGSDTNVKFAMSSTQVHSYNDFYANEIYSRSGSDLILGINGTEKIKIDNTNARVNIAEDVLIGGGTHYGALTINRNNSVAGTNFTTYSYYFYSSLAPASSSSQLGTGSYSLAIHANGWMNAWGYITFSDERIKKNIKPCECGLNKINELNVVEYEYIDKAKEGGERCGFIAQEVEKILPNSVKTSTNFIPDYYKVVNKVSDNCIKLGQDHGYIVGDKLKLINEDREYIVLIYRVDIEYVYYNVIGEGGSVIIPDVDGKYFLYGKEVKNFKQIDNEYLNAISIKGVQELFKKNCQLECKLKNLCDKLGIPFSEL